MCAISSARAFDLSDLSVLGDFSWCHISWADTQQAIASYYVSCLQCATIAATPGEQPPDTTLLAIVCGEASLMDGDRSVTTLLLEVSQRGGFRIMT